VARIAPVEVRTAPFIAEGAKWVFLSKRYGVWKGWVEMWVDIQVSICIAERR
jgi:hypothetical protein